MFSPATVNKVNDDGRNVAEQDPSWWKALGAGHRDEVLLEGGDHVAAQQAVVDRDLSEHQRHHRQYDMGEVLSDVLGDRYPAAFGE
ncbi:MAG: hypothetical protein R2698_09540 [Microthrixaceae bacterium]